MITRAGLAAFLSPKVNAMLKKVLKVWTEYLDSAASRSRALIFIEADGPIGLMCLIPVGMAEVSSCVTIVEENRKVKKGDQIFRKGVVSQFGTQAIPPGPNGANSPVVKVNSFLAMAN